MLSYNHIPFNLTWNKILFIRECIFIHRISKNSLQAKESELGFYGDLVNESRILFEKQYDTFFFNMNKYQLLILSLHFGIAIKLINVKRKKRNNCQFCIINS